MSIIKEGNSLMLQHLKLYCLIYELNGMVRSISELINCDDSYNNPIIEPMEDKMKEIILEIENANSIVNV